MSVLNVQNLNVTLSLSQKETGQVLQAVRNVSFEIEPGQAMGLVGESGCGKSMTARALLGLIPASARARVTGKIWLDNMPMHELSESQKRPLRGPVASIVFQDPMTALSPFFTIGFQLEETLRAHPNGGLSRHACRKRAAELLGEVGISEPERRLTQYPHEFSGGMRQRVVIAMALAHKPKLLVADEPTTGLDASTQVEILQLLRSLQESKVTRANGRSQGQMAILFVSHDFSAVQQLCDRMGVMYAGEIVEEGRTADLLAESSHPYTKALLACRPQWRPRQEYDLLPLEGCAPHLTADSRQDPTQQRDTASLAGNLQAVEVRGLQVSFASGSKCTNTVLNDVNFEVLAGQKMGILGESGSGKSTCARAMVGLLPPTARVSGSVKIMGLDWMAGVCGVPRKTRSTMQMVFQDPFSSFDPRQTIGSALKEPLLVHGLSGLHGDTRVAEALQEVGLGKQILGSLPGQLSGGQLQRVAIARALLLEPRVLIADEAVSSLDLSLQAQIVTLLSTLAKKRNLTVIFISHDLKLVRYFCDTVAVLRAGSLVESGPVEEVFVNPKAHYTRELIASAVLSPASK